ncbi:MAG: hypothetical protein NC114_06575 [Ruminococcus flavefaciens]|nr:hypothetical protein [Ruminococcus flavefaciens]
MKLISTLFTTDQIEITMMIQNRQSRPAPGQSAANSQDAALISKYVSKVGNESLIFNPSVAVMVNSKMDRSQNAFIPLSLFYRFTGNLSAVYEALSDTKMYHVEGSALYVDKKRAVECARKLPLFRNTLTLIPDVYIDRSNTFSKGIVFLIDARPIGTITHQEALGLIEQLDHLDITSYTLMAGIIDELESANNRLSSMQDMIQKIYALLQQQQRTNIQATPKAPAPVDPFEWSSTVDWRPMS